VEEMVVDVSCGRKKQKLFFFQTFDLDFSFLRPWNPPLFIKGGRRIFYLSLCQILALDLTPKDPNRWLKVAIMNWKSYCENRLVGLATLGQWRQSARTDHIVV
jgi:hypothetical protein